MYRDVYNAVLGSVAVLWSRKGLFFAIFIPYAIVLYVANMAGFAAVINGADTNPAGSLSNIGIFIVGFFAVPVMLGVARAFLESGWDKEKAKALFAGMPLGKTFPSLFGIYMGILISTFVYAFVFFAIVWVVSLLPSFIAAAIFLVAFLYLIYTVPYYYGMAVAEGGFSRTIAIYLRPLYRPQEALSIAASWRYFKHYLGYIVSIIIVILMLVVVTAAAAGVAVAVFHNLQAAAITAGIVGGLLEIVTAMAPITVSVLFFDRIREGKASKAPEPETTTAE
ncbi:hypothetical protein [Hydrogenimonas sp. SS33]|uniref:hypothetical protein n=1 Tax=Hydrogenimonas leucolamina TaxID=2954236 RepID=UPI00336C1BB2